MLSKAYRASGTWTIRRWCRSSALSRTVRLPWRTGGVVCADRRRHGWLLCGGCRPDFGTAYLLMLFSVLTPRARKSDVDLIEVLFAVAWPESATASRDLNINGKALVGAVPWTRKRTDRMWTRSSPKRLRPGRRREDTCRSGEAEERSGPELPERGGYALRLCGRPLLRAGRQVRPRPPVRMTPSVPECARGVLRQEGQKTGHDLLVGRVTGFGNPGDSDGLPTARRAAGALPWSPWLRLPHFPPPARSRPHPLSRPRPDSCRTGPA